MYMCICVLAICTYMKDMFIKNHAAMLRSTAKSYTRTPIV